MFQLFRAARGYRLFTPSRTFFTTMKKPIAPEGNEVKEDAAPVDEGAFEEPNSCKVEVNQPEDSKEHSPSEQELLQMADIEEKITEIAAKITIADLDAEQASKRYYQAREDAGKYAVTKFAKDSLEVADNLRRVALSASPEQIEANPEVKQLIQSVNDCILALSSFYSAHGIKEEDPVGKDFDPNLHEAMFEMPLPHQKNGSVAHVIQTGYLIHERVLRPARVGVVRNS